MANLAIRGHIKHGWRTIKILEMLGGVNKFNLDGKTDAWYVLEESGTIRWCELIFEERGFTLEEFFEKYPYKIGDRVRVPEYESEVRISKPQQTWTNGDHRRHTNGFSTSSQKPEPNST